MGKEERGKERKREGERDEERAHAFPLLPLFDFLSKNSPSCMRKVVKCFEYDQYFKVTTDPDVEDRSRCALRLRFPTLKRNALMTYSKSNKVVPAMVALLLPTRSDVRENERESKSIRVIYIALLLARLAS